MEGNFGAIVVTVVNIRSERASIAICRPTRLGNPIILRREEDRDDVLAEFAAWWYAEEQRPLREYALKYIPNDAALGCYCAPKRCHGDIIAGYLNWKRL